ncbi:MAG: hypothetical protein EA352_10025 [Gemmatimonadales bacterium]|nr:MAG: hypothetical protein EA352_10025 [Gemmatimonadales bacterium]
MLYPERMEIRGPGWEEARPAREEERRTWAVRSAAFSALALAREVFGEDAEVRRARFPGRNGIEGLVTLSVPMDREDHRPTPPGGPDPSALEAHREREARFLSLAAQDPVLRQTRVLYVFEALRGSGSRTRRTA